MRGHIHKRVKKGADGKPKTYWYVVVDIGLDDEGKRRQKWHGSYKTRREAEQASVSILRELEQRTYVEPRKLTLAAYVSDEWLPQMQQQVKASTFDSYSRNLALHVLPTLGGRQIQAITPGHLNSLYRQLLENGRRNGPKGRGLSPKTVRYVHTTLSKVFADAVDQELMLAQSCRSRQAAEADARDIVHEVLDTRRAREVPRARGTHRWYTLWRLAAMTGMRRGELLGLRWGDVDFGHARLAVRQTLISIAYQPSVSTPKSHRSRVIDLDAQTVAVLRTHASKRRHEPGDLVFVTDDGDPIHPESVRVVFERLPAHAGVPLIRFHDLRHTHATVALRAGCRSRSSPSGSVTRRRPSRSSSTPT